LQASPAELQQALTDRHAVELDGAWRTVDKTYMDSLLETALFLAIQQGWSTTALPQQDLIEGLQANGHDARYVACCWLWCGMALLRSFVWSLKTLLLLHLPSTSIISILVMWSFARYASVIALHLESEHLLVCHIVLCTPTLICASTVVALLSSDVTKLYAIRQVGAPFPVCVCRAARRRHLEPEGAYGKHGF